MATVLDLWAHQPLWFWWALGALLVGLEVASTTTYLLWPGIAAFAVGLAVLIYPPLDGRFAIFLFAALAVAATLAGRRWFPLARPAEESTLNRRSAQLIGRNALAADDFNGGRGAVLLDDTRWSARTNDGSDPKRNARLTITAADGTMLTVTAG